MSCRKIAAAVWQHTYRKRLLDALGSRSSSGPAPRPRLNHCIKYVPNALRPVFNRCI